jgi:hypothetical protein
MRLPPDSNFEARTPLVSHVGDGWMMDDFRQHLTDLGVAPNVVLTGDSLRESARARPRLFAWRASAVALLDLYREAVAATTRRASNVRRG